MNPFGKQQVGVPRAPWFYNVSDRDISRIDMDHLGKRMSYVRKENYVWYFVNPENIPVDKQRFGGMTLLLSGPQGKRELLSETIENPEQYGLVNPTTMIDITLEGDRLIQFNLGDKTPNGTSHYAQMRGFDDLYLIDASWGDVISRLVKDPPYPLWYLKMDPNKVVGVKIRHNGVDIAFKQEEQGWVFDDDENSPIDQERWASVLPRLGEADSITFVEVMVEDASSYGITENSTQIVIIFKTSSPAGTEYNDDLIYNLGNKAPDGSGYYAQATDFEPVFILDTLWIETFINLATSPPYDKSS